MTLGRRAAALIVLAVLVSACSEDAATPDKSRITAPKKAKASKEEAAVAAEKYRYDPTDKPDPFRSYVRQIVSIGDEALSSPLQRFDLSQLIVTGVIWKTKPPRALIEDPTGKGYIVEPGVPIGKNRGRIVAIRDNKVVVKETYVDFRERATTNEIEMHLHEGSRQ